MAAGKAKLLPFDPFAPQPRMSYKDGYQKVQVLSGRVWKHNQPNQTFQTGMGHGCATT